MNCFTITQLLGCLYSITASDKFSTLVTIFAIAESFSTLWIHLDLHVQKCSIRLLAKGCDNILVSERLALKTANRWTPVRALRFLYNVG